MGNLSAPARARVFHYRRVFRKVYEQANPGRPSMRGLETSARPRTFRKATNLFLLAIGLRAGVRLWI